MPVIMQGGKTRRASDYYPTQIEVCRSVCREMAHMVRLEQPRILDPGAGDGVWGEAAREVWPKAYIVGVELRTVPAHPAYDQWKQIDYVQQTNRLLDFDLVIGNPPYSLASEFSTVSYAALTDRAWMAFLLPNGFMHSGTRRRKLWPMMPLRYYYVMPERPSFVKEPYVNNAGKLVKPGNTDATDYAIYVWQKNYIGDTVMRFLDWEKPNRRANGHKGRKAAPVTAGTGQVPAADGRLF